MLPRRGAFPPPPPTTARASGTVRASLRAPWRSERRTTKIDATERRIRIDRSNLLRSSCAAWHRQKANLDAGDPRSPGALELAAPIRDGRYSFDERLSDEVVAQIGQRGVVHCYALFTGHDLRSVRGETRSSEVLGTR